MWPVQACTSTEKSQRDFCINTDAVPKLIHIGHWLKTIYDLQVPTFGVSAKDCTVFVDFTLDTAGVNQATPNPLLAKHRWAWLESVRGVTLSRINPVGPSTLTLNSGNDF